MVVAASRVVVVEFRWWVPARKRSVKSFRVLKAFAGHGSPYGFMNPLTGCKAARNLKDFNRFEGPSHSSITDT